MNFLGFYGVNEKPKAPWSKYYKGIDMNFEVLIAFLLAGLIVFGGVYMLMNRFFKQESERRAWEWRKQNNDIVLPIRLRAYERIVLFLSRIDPKSLLLRFDFCESPR